MSIITYGLDPISSHLPVYGLNEILVEVIVVDREASSRIGGGIPFGFPGAKGIERDIIIKIKQEDEDEWKFLFIENVDDNADVLFAKVIGIVGDKEKAKEVSFRIQEQVSKGNKNFKLSVKEA
jgi:hypothetical protein